MTERTDFPLVASVYQTAQRCDAENLGVSYKLLQAWIKSGQLRVIPCGSRVLVNWNTLLDFINGGQVADNSPLPYRRRRR